MYGRIILHKSHARFVYSRDLIVEYESIGAGGVAVFL